MLKTEKFLVKHNRSLLMFVLFISVLSAHGHAQTLGTVVGTVTDTSSSVVPGATVTVSQEGTGLMRSAITDSRGRYIITSLRPSRYTLTAELPGFKKYVERITLLADQALTVNIRLELGEVSETVTVEGFAVRTDTQTPTLSQVIEERRMVELPLNGRNAAQLTLLVAGTVAASSGGADQGRDKTFPGAMTISTNGSRQNQISYHLDGGNYNDIYTNVNQVFPFPDALQEFSVQTSNYSAEFGQNAGGVVNVVAKSGTNELHGTLFGFHRNRSLNARNFFQADRDPLKRTQFGFTVGGPAVKDRTFFFGGYQGTRIRSVQRGLSAFVTTDANRQGDFSALLDASNPANPVRRVVNIVDPLNGQPFPGNIIPRQRFDPAAVKFLEFIPRAGGNGRIRFDRPLGQNFDEFLIKVDHNLRQENKLTVRYFNDEFDDASGWDGKNLLTLTPFANIRSQNVLIGDSHVFGPKLINDFRFSYSRIRARRGQPDTVPSVTDFGVNIFQPGRVGIQSINVSGFFSVGANVRAAFIRDSWNWRDDVKWIRGRHNVAFGGEVERSGVVLRNLFLSPGTFMFTNDITNYAIANLLLGKLRFFRQGAGEFKDNRANFFSFYFQDTYQFRPRLTLTFGIRWDPFQPWREIRGRVVQFRPDAFLRGETSRVFVNAPPGMFFPGDTGVPKDGTTSDYNNFAPRVGFAWDMTGDGKTVLRGGAGIFYDSRRTGIENNRFVNVTPFSPQITVTDPEGPFSNPLLSLPNPFPAPFPPPADASFPRPVLLVTYEPGKKFVSPLSYNWNLTLERQLTRSLLWRAAYVGSHGSHIYEEVQLNPARFIPGSRLGTDARRRFQGFGGIRRAADPRIGQVSLKILF